MTVDLPDEAWAVALTMLPGMGPTRLGALLGRWTPREAWRRVETATWTDDRVLRESARFEAGAGAGWAARAVSIDVGAVWARHVDAEVGVATSRSCAFPAPLVTDIEPPAVVFTRGDPAVISGPRVAVVGTRSASRYGLDLAYELGHDLAAAGVAVVSGLAAGIDGAAHAGALAAATAAPIAVVGSGLDVVYPRRNAALWREVEHRGVVLSEAPLGAAPERWRFPARNRIIAALADAVVVVESRESGGSLHTVAEAERRGRPVFAVPGPIRSAASAGTNRLLRDGAHVLCEVGDVLVTLGLSAALSRGVHDARSSPTSTDAAVLEAVGWAPASFDQVAARTAVPLGELAMALTRLEAAGWLTRRSGWFERVARSEPS